VCPLDVASCRPESDQTGWLSSVVVRFIKKMNVAILSVSPWQLQKVVHMNRKEMAEEFNITYISDWLRAGRPRSRSSSPGMVMNFLRVVLFDSQDTTLGRNQRFFPHYTISRPSQGPTHPPVEWVPGVTSPRVKRPGRKADHSPSTSAEVNKTWIYTSPHHVLMA
jgi:hypothetical protein